MLDDTACDLSPYRLDGNCFLYFRVESVNSAFIRLRKIVPYENRNKRLSKAKTLRSAMEYIRQLQNLIDQHDQQLQYSPCSHQASGHRYGAPGEWGSMQHHNHIQQVCVTHTRQKEESFHLLCPLLRPGNKVFTPCQEGSGAFSQQIFQKIYTVRSLFLYLGH